MDATPVNTVSGIGSGEASVRVGLNTEKTITAKPPTGSPIEDLVELSQLGVALSRAEVESRLRTARICEIRAGIKAGTFETPQRVDGTVERLLEILG